MKITEAEFLGMLVIALGSLFALFKVFAQPLIKGLTELTKSITSLDVSVQGLKEDIAEIKARAEKDAEHSSDAHRRLWEHNDEQDKRLDEHDKQLLLLRKQK